MSLFIGGRLGLKLGRKKRVWTQKQKLANGRSGQYLGRGELLVGVAEAAELGERVEDGQGPEQHGGRQGLVKEAAVTEPSEIVKRSELGA